MFSQTLNYPLISKDTKILFVGEYHRIIENYSVQLDLIKHYVENDRFNAIILEHPSSLQWVINRIIATGDTTGLHLFSPIVLCNEKDCEHNLLPSNQFIIDLAHYAKSKSIPIVCLDIEMGLQKTKSSILSIVSEEKISSNFEILKRAKTDDEIKNALLYLYDSRKKWQKDIPKTHYSYLNKILENFFEAHEMKQTLYKREDYLFKQFNTLLKSNKKLRPIAIYGLFHTKKTTDTISDHIVGTLNRISTAQLLMSNKKSVCKGAVSSIASVYFFKTGADSVITRTSLFSHEDLLNIKLALGSDKFAILRPKDIGLTDLPCDAFDFIIGINDAHKLMEHMRVYR